MTSLVNRLNQMTTSLSVACLLASFSSLAAQVDEAANKRDVVPPKPSSWVSDQAAIFTDEERLKAEAAAELVYEQYGMEAYLVSVSYLKHSSLVDFATDVEAEWCEGEKGLILAFERGSGKVSFITSPQFENYVTFADQRAAFAAASSAGTGYGNDLSRRLSATFTEAVSGLGKSFEGLLKDLRLFTGPTFILLLFVLALAIIGSLLFFLLSRVDGGNALRPARRRLFPTTEAPARLGGANGGGAACEMAFGRQSAPQQQSVSS